MPSSPFLFLFIIIFNLSPDSLFVTEGDTIKLNGERIRLTCIDAPEKGQPYGKDGTENLMNLLKGKDIDVVRESTDRYGRTLAWLIVDGDINN